MRLYNGLEITIDEILQCFLNEVIQWFIDNFIDEIIQCYLDEVIQWFIDNYR